VEERLQPAHLKDTQFWHRRAPNGGERAFNSPEELWQAAVEAFDWLHSHPLKEQVASSYQGNYTKTTLKKMRAFTWEGVAMAMGVRATGLRLYKTRPEYEEVMEWIENIIRTQKFEGAAAGLLNPTIIARSLGLAERMEHTGKDGGAIKTQDVSAEERLLDEARRLGIDIEALGLGGGAPQE
jgi:hypothetical protein